MERDTILFTGASHTFGLGLEWELDLELNSEEYLNKGVNLPIPRMESYQKYWRENRWPTLVCNELGYRQYNIHDSENEIKIGANSVDTIWMLIRDEDKIKELFQRTKYVILEGNSYIRWYDENLHGGIDGYKYPNTILEMIEIINNPNSEPSIVSKTLHWIFSTDPAAHMLEFTNKIKYLIKKYPEIGFLILPWHVTDDGNMFTNETFLKNNLIQIKGYGNEYACVNEFLQDKKLQVWNKAKAFNGNYTYNHIEEHASVEGHQEVAKMVINYIKKIENQK
jgi:hypothetical protein